STGSSRSRARRAAAASWPRPARHTVAGHSLRRPCTRTGRPLPTLSCIGGSGNAATDHGQADDLAQDRPPRLPHAARARARRGLIRPHSLDALRHTPESGQLSPPAWNEPSPCFPDSTSCAASVAHRDRYGLLPERTTLTLATDLPPRNHP